MKPNYFTQAAPDKDDQIIQVMISEGRVPASCLWGGVLVQRVALSGSDPCEYCPCPYRKSANAAGGICHGRDQKRDHPGVSAEAPMREVREITDDEAGARKLVRRGHMRLVRYWLDEAEKEQ